MSVESRLEFTSLVSLPLVGEELVPRTPVPSPEADLPLLDADAVADFRAFLDKNKDALGTGMGAFHTDNHSNW